MEIFIKYLKRLILLIFIIFISIFIYFWNTSDYEYSSPGDDPEYVDHVIYQIKGYEIISYPCYDIWNPTVIIEDNYFIYVEDAIYESPAIMKNPESKGRVYYITEELKESFLSESDLITNCYFDFTKKDFIKLSEIMMSLLTEITGTQESESIINSLYYCTDKWKDGIYDKPDYSYRGFTHGDTKQNFRCLP
jgi:hypothetical protein